MKNVHKGMQLGEGFLSARPVLWSAPLVPIAREPEDNLAHPDVSLSLPLPLWVQEGPSERSARAVQGTAGLAGSRAEPVCRFLPDPAEQAVPGQCAAVRYHAVQCL